MGRWVNDKRSGYGVLRNNLEGWRFLSLWKEDKKHGRGIFIRFVFKSCFLAIMEDHTGRNCFSYCTTVPYRNTKPCHSILPLDRSIVTPVRFSKFSEFVRKTVLTVPKPFPQFRNCFSEPVRSSMLATLVTN